MSVLVWQKEVSFYNCQSSNLILQKMRLIDFSCGVCLCIFDLAQCDRIYRIINLCVYLL